MSDPSSVKISVSMIVKNESACLATALQSVADSDEIVVVDTGSDDDTIAIAEAHGATVHHGERFQWCDNFSVSRNQSLDLCTGDWVLIIDADEELRSGDMAKIRRACAATTAKALYFDLVSASNPEQVHRSIRCFRRLPEIRWRGAIHNYLSCSEGEPVDAQITYGYSEAHKKDPDRALRILSAEVGRYPEAARERYYLAREYWYRNNYAEAIVHWREYLKVATWAPEMADAWLMLARCHVARGNLADAREACLRAIQINTNFHEALVLMASLTGPKNSRRWAEWAKTATNEDVLFVRSHPK